eukprot:jgi/Ulvmu1/2974/UM015_0014.1
MNMGFMPISSPMLPEHEFQTWDRQIERPGQDPHLGSLKPTGQPPTASDVINFDGTLQELVEAAAMAQPGTTFDLNGASVQASTGRQGRRSTLSAQSLDDLGTEGPDPSDGTGTPATSHESNETSMVMYKASLGLDLMAMPREDSIDLEPCHSFDSEAGFPPVDARCGASSPLSLPDDTHGFCWVPGVSSLRKIASQASLRPRSPDEHGGSLGSAACMRHSCSFDSKRLDDHLNPYADVAPITPVRLGDATVTIRNGTLALPAGALLLLEQCKVVLEDVHIRGRPPALDAGGSNKSLPVLFVSDAEATLVRCSVGPSDGHGVGVGEAARVTLRDCELSNHRTFGLVVRGDGAAAAVEDCRLECNGQDGVAVGAGATAELSRCALSHNTMLGLCVSAGGSAVVEACTVEGNGTHGLSAQGGAALTARACRISGCEVGVLALDAQTAVALEGCEVSCNEHGIHARDGVQVTAKQTNMRHQSIGVVATGGATKVCLEDCTVTQSRRAGLHIFGSAVAKLLRGKVSGSAEHGALVQHARSVLELVDTALVDNGASGVQAAVGAAVQMHGCRLAGNRVAGAQVTDTSSVLALRDCDLNANGTIGLFANKGSSITAADCRFNSNGSSGCEVRDRGTRADIAACALRDNGRVGVYVHSAACLDLSASVVAANRSLALLSGGRIGTDIGGGVVTCSADTSVSGGTKVRHGGRLYTKAADDEPVAG